MDNKTAAEKIRAYYKSIPNKGQRPVFKKVKYSHEEVIARLMPYLKKGASRYDSVSKNVIQGTLFSRLKECFKVRYTLGEHHTVKRNERCSNAKDAKLYEEYINKFAEEKASNKGCSADLGDTDFYKMSFKEGYKEGCRDTRKFIVHNLRESGYSEKDIARILLECGFTREEINVVLGISEQELWNLMPRTRREINEDLYNMMREKETDEKNGDQ
ncbi:hypothetical protein SFC66_04560 [Terribacillus saccharophilus]|uniref:hypothetical protein n=1 Tax=Terribacillus saccharophilus TaxID=361277 RepID=UPI003981B676